MYVYKKIKEIIYRMLTKKGVISLMFMMSISYQREGFFFYILFIYTKIIIIISHTTTLCRKEVFKTSVAQLFFKKENLAICNLLQNFPCNTV